MSSWPGELGAAVPEKVHGPGADPPVAVKTDSLRVVPLRVITCLSGVGLTVEPGLERKLIEVPVLPARIGTIRGATQAECSSWIIRVITGLPR